MKFSPEQEIGLISMRLRHASFIALGSLLSFTACREAKIASYRVPKEAPPPEAASADMASQTVPTAQGGHDLTWTAPDQWIAKATSPMRRGSFTIQGPDGSTADLSITAFPGDVGGTLANVNRWRGQIQLPPIDEATLAKSLTIVQAQDVVLTMVEMANPGVANPQRILGALINLEGNTWFFKLIGPDTLVAAEKNTFVDFLKTVKGHHH